MRKLARLGVCAVVLAAAAGCSSENDPGGDFNQNIDIQPGGEAPSFSPSDGSYPAGPYGTRVGSIMANLEFYGWRDPIAAGYKSGNFQKIDLSEYYDPDGTKDIKIIVLNASAVWCAVCKTEYSQMRDQGKYDQYRPKGVEFISVLFEDVNSDPAKPSDLETWGRVYKVQGPMFLDPGFKTGQYFSSDATPLNLIIDARTMKVIDKIMGYDYVNGTFWTDLDRHLQGR